MTAKCASKYGAFREMEINEGKIFGKCIMVGKILK